MPEKDQNNSALFVELMRQIMPYLSTIFLSMWGGVANHVTTLRNGRKKFQLKELIFDFVVSTFAGLITFYFCRSAGISETMSAVLIAISGHMGTRAIAGFETVYRRIIGAKESTNEQN